MQKCVCKGGQKKIEKCVLYVSIEANRASTQEMHAKKQKRRKNDVRMQQGGQNINTVIIRIEVKSKTCTFPLQGNTDRPSKLILLHNYITRTGSTDSTNQKKKT